MSLGVYPAQILVQTLEDQYGVRFFQETRSGQGSAACTYFAGKPCLLVSTSEPIWRQHFSVAHELFHLLTWDEKLFQQVSDNDHLREKNETRADAFAAGLLMPAEALRAEVRRVATDGKLSHAALITIARHFDVSLRACVFRLAHLRIITQSDAQRLIEDPTLRDLDKQTQREATRTSYQFNKAFTRLAYLCYEAGKISRARLAKALEVSLVDLPMFLNMAGLAEVEGEARVEVAYS
jgi:Zn-dependent peptidase ImmA (M78 family)